MVVGATDADGEGGEGADAGACGAPRSGAVIAAGLSSDFVLPHAIKPATKANETRTVRFRMRRIFTG